MLKWIETTGRSEEDAISAALFQLGLDRDDVSVEVIERAKSGFLGFGSNPAKVRVSYQEVDGKPRPVTDEPLLEEAPAPVLPAAKPAPEREETVLAAAKPAQKAAPAVGGGEGKAAAPAAQPQRKYAGIFMATPPARGSAQQGSDFKTRIASMSELDHPWDVRTRCEVHPRLPRRPREGRFYRRAEVPGCGDGPRVQGSVRYRPL